MQASAWWEHNKLDEDATREIVFWKNNFEICHGQPIAMTNTKPDILTYSDESNTDWGGYSVELGGRISKGNWSPDEELKSSTLRELPATHLLLASFFPEIQGKDVRHRTDSKNVESILQIGSRNRELLDEPVALYHLCHQFRVRLHENSTTRLTSCHVKQTLMTICLIQLTLPH